MRENVRAETRGGEHFRKVIMIIRCCGEVLRDPWILSSTALVVLIRAAFVWCGGGRVRLPHQGKGAAERERGREGMCSTLSQGLIRKERREEHCVYRETC